VNSKNYEAAPYAVSVYAGAERNKISDVPKEI
jgi:hypothetical protein